MNLDAVNATLVQITGALDDFMYTYILVILLVAVGLWFSFRTGFVQIRYIKDMFKAITASSDRIKSEEELERIEACSKGDKEACRAHAKEDKRISSFQALMVSTASRVGTGNIVGVATAIAVGGPGSVFWMWLMAIIGSASAFIESTLAQIWKIKNPDGTFRGGPAYYIQQALHMRWLGIIFAIALILCFAFGFNGLQAFNVSSAIGYYIPAEYAQPVSVAVGILLVILTALIIFGGAHRISVISSVMVP